MMRQRKTIIILVAGVLLLFVIIGSVILLQQSKGRSTSKSSEAAFTVKDLDDSKYLFTTETQAAIKLGIEQYLKADGVKTDGVVGIIRKDSYTTHEENEATVSTMLIDLPEVKRTYKISSSGSGDADGNNSLFILCPSESELIYGAFDCEDDTV